MNYSHVSTMFPAASDRSAPRTRTTTFPVILCGGSGTRLWPASRDSMPKQFIRLLGEHSSFQTTARRLAGPGFGRLTVMSSDDVRFIVAEQLHAVGIEADIVLEPVRRDSAAAVAVAACLAARRDPNNTVLVVAADHVIEDDGAFVATCREAVAGAQAGFLMTLGVTPTAPATGYGYIQPGATIPGLEARQVVRFVEKPDAATAERYLQDGYLWNSGNILFRSDVMIEELRRHAPEILAAAQDATDRATRDLDFLRLDAGSFARAAKISIDYAVLERTDRAGVLPMDCGWSDIGTWGAVWGASERDASGNAVRGDAEVIDTSDSLVSGEEVLTAVVGLSGVVVVATPDAVLVTSRERSDDVKTLVSRLKERRRPEAEEHRRMYRPWGWYMRIDVGQRFQVKRILVKPGHHLSLQKHFHRAEHWVVVRGTAEVTIDDTVSLRHENEAAYLPIGCVHRLANPGRIDLEMIEVQVGSYTGEDDILRLEDRYGR